MREIWRKTVEIFWEHPVLWLPFVIADLCTFALSQSSSWSARAILYSQTTSRSVLGGKSAIYNPAAIHNAWMYSAPIAVAAHYLNVCLLTAAFVLIARATQLILQEQTGGIGLAFAELKTSLRRILWFSLKFCVCMMAGALIAILPTMLPLIGLRPLPHLLFEALTWTSVLAGTAVVAWVATPMGMKLVAYPGMAASADMVALARKFALAAGVANVLAGLTYNDAIRPHLRSHSRFEGHALGAVATLVIDVPLLLLFIALGILLAGQADSEEELHLSEPEPF
ncbi:MAG TPA: hypothetical protein VKB38_16505 [Terracidiphilus sp.]|nr:hypothetical protein [Terracidiphilus sp.]